MSLLLFSLSFSHILGGVRALLNIIVFLWWNVYYVVLFDKLCQNVFCLPRIVVANDMSVLTREWMDGWFMIYSGYCL